MHVQIATEAAIMARGVHWRCVTAPEAAEWAATWIAKLDQPPVPLVDISFAARWPEGDLLPLFEPLTRTFTDLDLIPETLGLLASTLRRHPERIDSVCAALSDLEFSRRLPSDMHLALGALFRLQDARACAYDTVENVTADVIAALQPYFARFATA